MIPYGRQNINQSDIDAVVDVLKSDFLTQGPVIPRFEKAVSDYVGVKYAFAVNSATSGLHIACMALGLKEGDLVWTSPISFVASANCAKYCGADVDFVDIDPITYNLSVAKLHEKLVEAEKVGKLPKIVIPVHLAGQSCDMESIKKLSEAYGFRIIEDASHAIGGSYKDKKVGSCEYSDITVFSFHPVKIITTGEGGMVCTNQQELASKLYRLRSHGITREPTEMTQAPDGPWYYQQLELGI
jgi:dTDP-4-amino-4,6-dideoxygalactose transaminase